MATEIVFKRDHKLGTLWSLLLAWVAESEGERDWAKRFLDEVRKRWEGAKGAKLGESFLDWQGWQRFCRSIGKVRWQCFCWVS